MMATLVGILFLVPTFMITHLSSYRTKPRVDACDDISCGTWNELPSLCHSYCSPSEQWQVPSIGSGFRELYVLWSSLSQQGIVDRDNSPFYWTKGMDIWRGFVAAAWIPAQHTFLVSGWFLFPCLHTHSYSCKSSCLRHLHIDSHELRLKANVMGSLMTVLVLSLLALTLEDFWVPWNIETWKVSIVIDSNYHILSKNKNNSIFHTFKFWILTINGLGM